MGNFSTLNFSVIGHSLLPCAATMVGRREGARVSGLIFIAPASFQK